MHHHNDADQQDAAGELTSRRQIMKKAAVGAAAAGVVWSAPKIEGLSLRPNYAAAASGAPASGNVTMFYDTTLPGAAGTTSLGGGFASARGNRVSHPFANTITLNEFNYNGSPTAQITAINTGGNVSDVIRIGGIAATFPANLDAVYDAAIVNSADRHTVRVTFSCS